MFYKDKKVLVSGGTGFVGSHIVEQLLRQGAIVRVPIHSRGLLAPDARIETVAADLSRLQDCRNVLKGIDYCFHAAGSVGAAGVKGPEQMRSIVDNLILTGHMLQAAWDEGLKRFLLFGSSTGYPVVDKAVKEEQMWQGPVHPSYLGYGWMRRYLEKLAEFTSMNSSLKIAIIRPAAVYGPFDNFDEHSSHVIPALIRKAMEGQDPFVVWGTGEEVRDFIHVSDLAVASLLAVEKYPLCDAVNIGSGQPVTISELVHLVLEASGRCGVKVVFDPSRPTTIPFRAVDISKAKNILGFEPKISLRQGIFDTVAWYRLKKDSR